MDYSINTKCVQAGYTPGNGEPRQIPIYQSTDVYKRQVLPGLILPFVNTVPPVTMKFRQPINSVKHATF